MDIRLPGHRLCPLLFRVCCPRPHPPVEVCLSDLVDTHNHLVYHAGVGIRMLGKHCRIDLAVCRFSLPVVTQQILLVENIIIVRGQQNRANQENRLCKALRITLVVCQRHIGERRMRSESPLCNIRLDTCCCSFSHYSFPPHEPPGPSDTS